MVHVQPKRCLPQASPPFAWWQESPGTSARNEREKVTVIMHVVPLKVVTANK